MTAAPAPTAPRQLAPDDVPQRRHDVLVVGAGPAGAIAARTLAGRGHDVLLVDRQRFPRDKACGDALMPDAVRFLRRQGLFDRVAPLGRAVTQVVGYSPSRIRFAFDGDFHCVPRRLFDAALADAAVEAGATFATGRVRAARALDDGDMLVDVDGAAPRRARYVLVATGADVSLLRAHGMVHRESPSAVAIRYYVHAAHDLDAFVFSFDREILPGYAWIFPVGYGIFNVGLGVPVRGEGRGEATRLRATLERFESSFPPLRELLATATARSPARGARLRCGLAGTALTDGDRLVAAGESIGATFPFSGEGIGKAMETAELAADALHRALAGEGPAALASFGVHVERELRPRYLGYQVAERWVEHPWITDFLAFRARTSRRARRMLTDIVDERLDPRHIFSVRGLFISLFG